MAQIFRRFANPLSKASIFGPAFAFAFLAWAGGLLVRSPYVTQAGVVRE